MNWIFYFSGIRPGRAIIVSFSKSRKKLPERSDKRQKFTLPDIKYSLKLFHYHLTLLKMKSYDGNLCISEN